MPSPDSRSLSLAILLLAGLTVGLPWAAGGRSPTGQASLVLILVLAAAVGLFPRGHAPRLRSSPLLLAAAVLAGGSALHTIYPDRTVQSLLLLLAYLLAGTLAAQGAREVAWAERLLLTAILLSGILVTGVGLLRLFWGSDAGLYAHLLTGPFGYPNAMAGFLLVTGGAALALAGEDRGLLIRVGAMGAGGLMGAGLVLSRSRGALLAAGIGFTLWAAIERRAWWPRRRLWRVLGGMGLLAGLVWAAKSAGSFLPWVWRLGNPLEDSSLVWRKQILQWTWAMARDHPWWGVGPGAFPVALTQYQRLPYVSGENPHNLYLELAAEYGVPAGILAVLTLGGFLGRMGSAIWRATPGHPARRRLAALLATLVAFAVHSLVDLDWSFPAIAVPVATMLGLASAHLPRTWPRAAHPAPLWRRSMLVLMAAAAVLCLTRYYAGALVTWARLGLAAGETATAERDLTWALRLNPVGFPAHYWMAWARLRTGDLGGAAEAAERAIRIAPADPNSRYLAGEVAAATGRWDVAEDRFRAAVERAPAAQLRFHAGLVEAAARGGRAAEARFRYEKAVAIFTPERVLGPEGRCLVPGDRYLLARMSRIAFPLYDPAGDSLRRQAIRDRAMVLAQPDARGICVTQGRPGQTSPEAVMESFWRALTEGGWAQAEGFLTPRLRTSGSGAAWTWWQTQEQPRWARVAWIAALQGGERQASLRFEMEIETIPGRRISRCAQADSRLIGKDWFVDRLPVLEPEPCQP